MHVHSFSPQLAILLFMGFLGFVLPEPANVTAFVAAIGFGIAIGGAAIVERIGRAKIVAKREWEEANRNSILKQVEEANQKYEETNKKYKETVSQITTNRENLLKIQSDLDAEKVMNEKLREDLMGFALRVLEEKGYVTRSPETENQVP
jgi:vacuolar-type H+-ATPase subunit I/STV1